ncbi:MAG TPA: SsrA-binding protein SmpB [Longimicrobiales bacterium]|nr:SsrA-binding protein SmpB [Longimicrobiales bacterium]
MPNSSPDDRKILARNRKALHEYHVIDSWEAGIVLTGPEVKSIRAGKASLAEAFAMIDRGELWLRDMHVSPYEPASRENANPVRPRKLLLNRSEIRRLIGATQQKGFTLIPLDVYLRGGRIKVTLALGRGKKLHDKRETLKRKTAEREVERAVKQRE